ncbi:MAG: sugar transferase, partial [Deltaproteobacteria bacterium]|nr:sugar transferase [Deltaproteobacteria bacterium]
GSVSIHIIVINLLIFGTVVIIMYGARSLAYSRLVIFGTIALLTVLEIIVSGIYRLTIQNGNGNGAIAVPKRKRRETHIPPDAAKLKATHDLRIREFTVLASQLKKDIVEECGQVAYDYISENIDLSNPKNLVVSTTTRFNILYQPDGYLNGIVNLKRVNDIRFINKFFETINVKLPVEGRLIGCAETKDLRKARILRKFPPGLNWIYYFFDYIIKRVLPKFQLTKNIYFILTRGQNRVLTRAEILGRLYSCGFEVEDETFVNGRYFFSMSKVSEPVYPKNPTYGMLVRLPRVGYKGEIIRVYKMRTMHPYAEYLQSYVYNKHSLQDGGKFHNDFRISSAGRIMRALWLDELPMLLNWMRGELKLVGVRPISEQYYSLYSKDHQKRRIRYKPGLVPPFYADLPKTLEEIEDSESKYLDAYDKHPFRSNWRYFWKAWYNIIFKRARSH